jgi:chromosomal replication initiation ATPase DnaA
MLQSHLTERERWNSDPADGTSAHAAPARTDAAERSAIEYAVTQVFGVGAGELGRATRGEAKVALARQVAMYLAHVGRGHSFTAVGRQFARDRTTVAHACGVIEDRRDDPVFDRTLELLEQVVHALAGRHPTDPRFTV